MVFPAVVAQLAAQQWLRYMPDLLLLVSSHGLYAATCQHLKQLLPLQRCTFS